MQDMELIASIIDKYGDLQRIINAPAPKKETEYQMQITKAKLEALGVVTTDLNIGE